MRTPVLNEVKALIVRLFGNIPFIGKFLRAEVIWISVTKK